MEFLLTTFENSQLPLLSALILGLMTAISPCSLAANVTAIAYIGKDVKQKKRVFLNGLIYILGRAITYTTIGLIIYFSSSQFDISGVLQKWGEKLLGPVLIIVGIFMLDIIKINFSLFGKLTKKVQDKNKLGFFGVLLLGIVLALAFCPFTIVLYFVLLIPMTISSSSGLYLPIIFAIGTGLPVIIFAWIIAFAVNIIGTTYKKMQTFELWFRRFIAIVFIGVGIYFISIFIGIF